MQVDTVACTISITAAKCYNYVALMLLVLLLDSQGFFVPVDVFRKIVGRNTYVSAVLTGSRLELAPQHLELARMEKRTAGREPGAQLSDEAKTSLAFFIEALSGKDKGASRLIISPAASAAAGGISFRDDASGDNNKGFGGVFGPVALHGSYSADCPPIEVFTIA